MKVKNTFNRLKLLFSYREINAYKEAIEKRENAIVSDTLNYMYGIIGKNRVMLVDFTLRVHGHIWMNFKVTELMFINTHLIAKIDGKWTCQPFEHNGCTFKEFGKLVEFLNLDSDIKFRNKTDQEKRLTWFDITYMPLNKAYKR